MAVYDLEEQEQIAELKAHYLSSSLYFTSPTTTHYADLQTALSKGEVDTRLSYKIDVGNAEITALAGHSPVLIPDVLRLETRKE